MQNRRRVSRNDAMIEEHKKAEQDSDSEGQTAQREKGFEEEDCESDYEDQLCNIRKAKRQKREHAERQEARRIIPAQFLPSSNKKLSACVSCRLVLNKEKWRKLEQCPNCPQSQGYCDTTENFSNMIGSIYPKQSWVASWLGMKDLIPGFYAMSITQEINVDE